MRIKPIFNYQGQIWLWCEFILFALIAPLSLVLVQSKVWFIPLLWIASLLCLVHLHNQKISVRTILGWDAVNKAALFKIFFRFIPLAIAATAFMLIVLPESWLSLYRRSARLWLLVMLLYPLLSVLPQEIIYRVFMFDRYRSLFTKAQYWILASAIAFALAHLFLKNALAPLLSLLGGLIFASTYNQSRSLVLACIEHSLYGNLLFTLGMGQHFYHGTVMHS
jgi:uncharacterized protein